MVTDLWKIWCSFRLLAKIDSSGITSTVVNMNIEGVALQGQKNKGEELENELTCVL